GATVSFRGRVVSRARNIHRREFQGQGFLHVLLEEPFRIARERKFPCVLDTDTELKVKKYISCGMKKMAETSIKGGGTMYTMESRA
ncbi:MAG: hypothetical protein LUD12_11090, partial [Lachnospiraceae bacterium]|nr:hypothetical protein [Lachnospiraceae bacterium]